MTPQEKWKAAFAKLEPAVADIGDDYSKPAMSIAISLKRIADSLERVADDFGAGPGRMGFLGRLDTTLTDALKTPLNQYGEGIGECIQGQLERGQR